MGRKKRTTDASHNHCSSAPPPPDAAAIKAECERALTALRRGNHTKALRLMKESTQRFETSALIHRVAGTISVKVSSIIDDHTAKLRHLRNAIESAKKAVTLSPNSVEFACFYASLLYETAVDGKDFDEVMAECERALAIEQPTDPAKDYDEISGESSGEARIAQVHQELRSLIQRSNLASLSTWMKGFTGEEKFRMISFGRSLQDPMESRYFQNLAAIRRPNEIKKAAKTLEERRREIEVRVAAARLLQQKSEQAQSVDQSNGNDSVSTINAASKNGDRRRHTNSRRNTGSSEGKDQAS